MMRRSRRPLTPSHLRACLAAGAVVLTAAVAPPAIGAAPPAPALRVTALYEGVLYLKVLDVRADFVLDPGVYRAGARVESAGAARLVKGASVLAQAQGRLAGGYPMANQFVMQGGRKRRVVPLATVRAADPITQLLRIGLRGAASPCNGPMPYFDGKQSYVVTFSPAGAGKFKGSQQRFGLTAPTRCRVGFQPIKGFKSKSTGGLSGDTFATFAKSQATGFWVMSNLSIGTVAGRAEIDLTGLKVAGRIPASAPAPQPRPRR